MNEVDKNSLENEVLVEDSQSSLFEQAGQSIKEIANVTSLLRIGGAVAVLASMSMFLMQGWSENNDFQRFLTMLAQTSLLGIAGFAMVKFLKEAKGSRLFFGLSLTSVTVNFATLGALIYSVFSWDQLAGNYASFALWKAASGSSALLSLGIALVVLIPLSWLAFSTLARPMSSSLTKWYIGMNMMMLIPVRDMVFIIPLAAIALIYLMKKGPFSKENTANNFSWKTTEGRYAKAILVLPFLIMVVRSLMSYDVQSLEILVISASAYFLGRMGATNIGKAFSWIPQFIVIASSLVFSVALAEIVPATWYLSGYTIIAITLIAASYDLYRRNQLEVMETLLTISMSILPVAILVLQQMADNSLLSGLTALVGAVVLAGIAYQLKSRVVMGMAGVLLLSIPFINIEPLIGFFANSGWVGLAIGGVSIIVLASVLDRYGSILHLKFFKSKEVIVEEDKVLDTSI